MTLSRLFAIAFCFSLLLPVAYGQQNTGEPVASQQAVGQMPVLDSLSTDSLGRELMIPNVFTPNGDGTNDYIEVRTDGATIYEFSIFTRTGTQVYHSLSPRVFWDGKNNAGNDVTEGVYYYVIEEEGDSDSYTDTGIIYLFR